METTKSQRDAMTKILEAHSPGRSDFELLPDGSLLVTLWRQGELRWSPYLMRRLGRRGEIMREANRTATGWSEFIGPVDDPTSTPSPLRGGDEATTEWMRK